MRIARIIEYFPPHIGGMEGHGLILSLEQIKLGHDVEIFIGYGDDRSGSTRIEADQRGNGNYPRESAENPHKSAYIGIYRIPLQFLPIYSKVRRVWFNFWAYNKVKKIHQKNPYNIVHIHGDFIEGYFGGKLSKKLGIPAVLTIHAGLNKRLLQPKNAEYFENISKIICVSNEIANDLKSIGIPENKIAVISSGIYLSEFKKTDSNKIAALQEKYSKPIIISVGVLRPAKGFKYLIDAFKKIKRRFNDATLIIIGNGPDRVELEKQAKDIDGINFLGRQDNNRVIEYLKAADIFVLASIFMEGDREGTSNSIMEAMASGLPLVATKVGGNSYLVKEGINGFLVEDRNSDELAEAVIKLINNPEICEKMRIRNLEDIKQKDWSIIAEKINEVYKSVL